MKIEVIQKKNIDSFNFFQSISKMSHKNEKSFSSSSILIVSSLLDSIQFIKSMRALSLILLLLYTLLGFLRFIHFHSILQVVLSYRDIEEMSIFPAVVDDPSNINAIREKSKRTKMQDSYVINVWGNRIYSLVISLWSLHQQPLQLPMQTLLMVTSCTLSRS